MPYYDFKCNKCDSYLRNYFKRMSAPAPSCSVCGHPNMAHTYDQAAPRPEFFLEGFYEHLAAEPLHFTSKRALRRYCRENDLTMDYAE